MEVVCITAKIHFLKQFTTFSAASSNAASLFVLLQRYTFWSNSQLSNRSFLNFLSCLYYCKDTLFEAIHNCLRSTCRYWSLFVLLQRYTFWSNSQLVEVLEVDILSCLYYCKDTLFEAIHNASYGCVVKMIVVCITAKIHFLKQFTTLTCIKHDVEELFVLLQRYTFWSNSQLKPVLCGLPRSCLYYCKDTLFEAIHNT